MKLKLMYLVLVVLLAGCQVTMLGPENQAKINRQKVIDQSKEKIEVYEIMRQEKQLQLDLLNLDKAIKMAQKQVQQEK